MRRAAPLEPSPESPRLCSRAGDPRREYFTEAPVSVTVDPNERGVAVGGRWFRALNPYRSKLGAAIVSRPTIDLPRAGQSWLYLGGASGTTATHVADLVGPTGQVVVVEKSPRPFARLLLAAHRYPNLLPVLADARRPTEYAALAPALDGLYADIAAPDQVEILRDNLHEFLPDSGVLLFVVKGSSMGRTHSPSEYIERVRRSLVDVVPKPLVISLEPFHRGHAMLVGRYRAGRGPGTPGPTDSRRRPLSSPPVRRHRAGRQS